MKHTDASKLFAYMTEPPGSLTGSELQDYIWLLEQLLQETRAREVALRVPGGSDG